MRIVHANWSDGGLHLWCETAQPVERPVQQPVAAGAHAAADDDGASPDRPPTEQRHPRTDDPENVRDALARARVSTAAEPAEITLRLPTADGEPQPSARLRHESGQRAWGGDADEAAMLEDWAVPTLRVPVAGALDLLERLDDLAAAEADRFGWEREQADEPPLLVADSVRFFAAAARLARSLVAQQRFVPMVLQGIDGSLRGKWTPWWSDEAIADQVGRLLAAMPAAVRAVVDHADHNGWLLLESFLTDVVDEVCRRWLCAEGFAEAIEDRDPATDDHVAWLAGLLAGQDVVPAPRSRRSGVVSGVRRWVGLLDDRGAAVGWRLRLRLVEPVSSADDEDEMLLEPVDAHWRLVFGLQSTDSDNVVAEAAELWAMPGDVATVDGRRIDSPRETLLRELGRAARIYPALERALDDQEPAETSLSTAEAHRFLREYAPALEEQGVAVERPKWWGVSTAQLGVLLEIDSEEEPPAGGWRDGGAGAETPQFGLSALVDYRWRVAVGQHALTPEQFEQLAKSKSPLVRIGGRWVEVQPERIAAVRKFLDRDEGSMTLGEAMRLAFAADEDEVGAPVVGVRAQGWAGQLLDDQSESVEVSSGVEELPEPEGFDGDLRRYQRTGLGWLDFLDRMTLGGCLADDMGLGKTIQLLALLQREREQAAEKGLEKPGPTLVIAPTSVVGNWRREANRFTPSLAVRVHHGSDRPSGDAFVEATRDVDLLITTYALAHRDFEDVSRIHWRRVVLDEAQNIKNPTAKQSRSVRSIGCDRRIALTGTPVENRLSELWSIMEFLNPGYLGPAATFRRRFSLPVERRRDPERSRQLRRLIRPFVLRRLKTDPTVIGDLPEKVETKEHAHLTPEQAALYEKAVGEMLGEVERAEGVRRRGVVLATLIRLKQICNHPALPAREWDPKKGPPQAVRSGKCQRLVEMLDEVVAAGDKALVFTQFRKMGEMLAAMLRHDLDRDILLLHGGTPQAAREKLIDRFQSDDKQAPIFILSLKAGGVGMNLTAASHVFHFDRWWNPAVENQATDRAYRIGQTQAVHVHKFVVGGTLEERIDEMLEQKMELAETIIGAGEEWLTELSTSELRDMLTLRKGAVED